MVKPTERELAILKVLWRTGPATVQQVHDLLAPQHPSVLTTTQKLMQIMARKGILTVDKSRRPHIFQPAEDEERTRLALLRGFVDQVFDGSPGQAMLGMLGGLRPSAEELDEVKAYLDNLEARP